jgi:hypothetical protein
MLKDKFDQVHATEKYERVKNVWRQTGLNSGLDKKVTDLKLRPLKPWEETSDTH